MSLWSELLVGILGILASPPMAVGTGSETRAPARRLTLLVVLAVLFAVMVLRDEASRESLKSFAKQAAADARSTAKNILQ